MSAPAKKLTAAQRTIPIPGVDLREQRDALGPAPLGEGPTLVRRVFLDPIATHLVVPAHNRPLCGATGRDASDKPIGRGVCEACRVEASRLRAVVIR